MVGGNRRGSSDFPNSQEKKAHVSRGRACLLGQADLNRDALTIRYGRQVWGTQKIPSCVTPDLSLGTEEEPGTGLLRTQWQPSVVALNE